MTATPRPEPHDPARRRPWGAPALVTLATAATANGPFSDADLLTDS